MAQLEQAFKKYQVEEAECEMYIACEASQVQRIEENGPLARIVYDILRYVDLHNYFNIQVCLSFTKNFVK